RRPAPGGGGDAARLAADASLASGEPPCLDGHRGLPRRARLRVAAPGSCGVSRGELMEIGDALKPGGSLLVKRWASLLYGAAAYTAFVGTTLYAIGFVAGVVVPRSVDAGGPVAPFTTALGVDLALLALFGVQHSVMARKGFKEAWTRVVPRPIERSTYVLASSACLALLFLLWHPIPRVVWSVGGTAGQVALVTGAGLAWLVARFSP